MKKKRKLTRKLTAFLLAAALCASGLSLYPVSGADESTATATSSSSTSYGNEINMLEDDEYADFGFILSSPDEFDPDDESNPLEGFETMTLSELYVGDMNREDSWTGSFRVMNDVSELSEETLSFESMANDLVGNEYSYSNIYPEDKSSYEVQTTNSAAIDYDGDGEDEIFEVTLYVNKLLTNDSSCMDYRLYDRNEDDEWEVVFKASINLADSYTDDRCWVDSIEADNSKAYTSIATGDYDNDGSPEIAFYVPSQTISGPYIAILEASVGKIYMKSKLSLSEFNINGNVFDYDISGRLMPVVSLSTTSISGQDDLVVNVSQPQTSDHSYDEHGQESVLAIYHCYGSLFEERLSPMTLTYGSQRMRFCSATDADINGNGTEELLVGGYLNEKWDDNTDVGSLSDEYNLIQAFCWNGTTYEEVWETPQQVQALSGLKTSTEMMEPAAFAAGQLSPLSNKDYVFLEGVISVFSTTTASDGSSEAGLLADGIFNFECETALNGTHSAFISQAYTAVFSSSGVGAEQLVILQGDHRSSDNDVIHYDICWAWYQISVDESSVGAGITSAVTDNDYITADEDDNGTFISICPLDCDSDTVYFEYEGKSCGWSSPTVYSILQSTPYWSELEYNSESFGVGYTKYEISIGSGSGESNEFSLMGGIFLKGSVAVGAGFLGNSLMLGLGLDIEGMAGYINESTTTTMETSSYSTSVRAGEDYAVVMTVPLVTYQYKMWCPTFTVDEDYVKNYNKLVAAKTGETVDEESKDKCPYAVGTVVEGHWEDVSIPVQLTPALTNLTVEEYNELAEAYGLTQISDDLLTETPGDPTTYLQNAKSLNAQEEAGDINNLFVSDISVVSKEGDNEQEISYEIEEEKESGNGFAVEFNGELYGVLEEEAELGVAEHFEMEMGLSLGLEHNTMWISSSVVGQSFTGVIKDTPEGCGDDYSFSSGFAVYAIDDDSDLDGVYVTQYIVEGVTDATAPPQVAPNLRVVGTTETAVVLAWDTAASRVAKSYEIYEKVGSEVRMISPATDETYYVVKNLSPGTTYEFAVQSYAGGLDSEGNCTGVSSVKSRYVEATTKSSDVTNPTITRQPENVVVSSDMYGQTLTMTVEAALGEGMEEQGYTLSYQWQKLTQKESTYESEWVNVEGAVSDTLTLPTVTEENEDDYTAPTHYRVAVTQQKDGGITVIYSHIASMYVVGDGSGYVSTELGIEMGGSDAGDTVISLDDGSGNYYTKTGANPAVTLTLTPANEASLSDGAVTVVYRRDGETNAKTATGTLTDGTVSITLGDEEGLSLGDYEIYGVYAGQAADNGYVHYLASQSDTVTLHVVDTYAITYHMDGGTNSTSNPALLTNESAAVTLADPNKTYYTFDGWYLDEELTEELAKDEDGAYTLEVGTTVTGDMDLYAVWMPVGFTITYELDGGTNNAANPETFTAETGMISLKDPSRDGYDFAGWYRDAELTDGPVTSLSGIYEDITLYAAWEEAEEEDPPFDTNSSGTYLISSYDDLVTMAEMIQQKPDKYATASYKQTCNIDCGDVVWEMELGTEEYPFNGTYDGNDFYILGLEAGEGVSGLFGVIGTSGTVKNLCVVDFDFSDSAEVAGGIAGVNQGTVDGCGSGVNITSAAIIYRNGEKMMISSLNSDIQGTVAGGIAGSNTGTIKNCRSNAVVTATETAGGIAGVNEGTILNVYNTGAVTGTDIAGGIVGKNEGRDSSIRYGYNCRAVSGSRSGGIAGSSENTNISDMWYLTDIGNACGNQDDSALGAAQITADEMKTEDFEQQLNNAISDQQEELDLRSWTQSSSKNEGYPMMERATLVQQTLTSETLGVSVSGMLPKGSQLSLIHLDEDSGNYALIREQLGGGTLLEGWYLALMYEDGTYCLWDGDLTITIQPETQELLSSLNIVHLNENEEYQELAAESDGVSLIVTTGTLGSFAVVQTGADDSDDGTDESGGNTDDGTDESGGSTDDGTDESGGSTDDGTDESGGSTDDGTDESGGSTDEGTYDSGTDDSSTDDGGSSGGRSGAAKTTAATSTKTAKTGDTAGFMPAVILLAAAVAACTAVAGSRRRRRQ